MSKVIAIGNNKGGVAKTTTAVNLAKGLADAGMRVLLIDADPQGNATAAVGFDEPDMIEENLATAMQKIIKDEDIEPGYGIIKNEGGFDVLPGNIELSELEAMLVNVILRQEEHYRYMLHQLIITGMITYQAIMVTGFIQSQETSSFTEVWIMKIYLIRQMRLHRLIWKLDVQF